MDTQSAIVKILTSPNAWMVIIGVVFLSLVAFTLMKRGLIFISTDKFHFGADYRERDIIRQQVEWTHSYIMGLYGKIQPETDNRYDGYLTKYILEMVYSEIVDWITFNHINLESEYLDIKKDKIINMIFAMNIDDKFKTPEFEKQIDEWVETVIKKLVTIRQMYK